jgi:acyl carrier protein
MSESTLDRIQKIYNTHFGTVLLDPKMSVKNDLGLDSLDRLYLETYIEKEFLMDFLSVNEQLFETISDYISFIDYGKISLKNIDKNEIKTSSAVKPMISGKLSYRGNFQASKLHGTDIRPSALFSVNKDKDSESLLSYTERNRFIRGALRDLGYKNITIESVRAMKENIAKNRQY